MKLPRNLSGQEVIRALKRLGFTVVRTPGSRKVTVPTHSSLQPKTLASILSQAQITIEELQAHL